MKYVIVYKQLEGGNVIINTEGGSGGVIDGTILYSEDKSVTLITSSTEVYTTKNDCLLTVQFGSTSTATIDVQFLIGDNIIYSTTDRTTWDVDTFHIPIKQGITLSAKLFNSTGSRNNFPIKFIEYKLNSLNPQLAFPDWDESKAISINSGDTIPANGWITYSQVKVGYSDILVNGIIVAGSGNSNNNVNDKGVVPVSKDDIITINASYADNTTVTFYPVKSVSQEIPSNCASYVIESGRFNSLDGTEHSDNSENDSWYRLYSDGWCE
jgi:hypothetical protein